MNPVDAREDFVMRLRNYELAYEPLEEEPTYIKVINAGEMVVSNRIEGYIPSQMVFYLMNSHLQHKTIYLAVHGETHVNPTEKLGATSTLTKVGEAFSHHLAEFVGQIQKEFPLLSVWTSTSREVIDTTRHIREHLTCSRKKALDGLHYGTFTGSTLESIKKDAPKEYRLLKRNRIAYRFPHGESVLDMLDRLKPVLIEMERATQPIMIVSHHTVLQILLAYFTGGKLIPFFFHN
jgi:6-phosphofructo-2-kinase